MLYHTHNTPGFVLTSTPSGESSLYVYIFTKDLGLVGVHAQNARNVNSKLRYALSAPARSVVSLIRGKNMWRLANASPEKIFYADWRDEPEKQKLCVQIFSSLKKLLAGEEPNPELFSTVENFLDFLGSKNFNDEELKNIEAIVMLRIMRLLGYLPDIEKLRNFYRSIDWSEEMLEKMKENRISAVKSINEALRETGL